MLLGPCLLQTLLYYILKQDRPSALQDAARVVDTFSNLTMTQAHLFRARFLVENQRVSRRFALDTHFMCLLQSDMYALVSNKREAGLI